MDGQAKSSSSWSTRITRRLLRGRPRKRPTAARGDCSSSTSSTGRKLPAEAQEVMNELGEREYDIFASGDSNSPTLCDHTELMHGLSNSDSLDHHGASVGSGLERQGADGPDSLDDPDPRVAALRRRRQAQLATIPGGVWEAVAAHLSPADRAHLALASRTLLSGLGGRRSLSALDRPENRAERVVFLRHLDRHLPDHLFCFACARYHRRAQPGREKPPTPSAPNPVVRCPAAAAAAATAAAPLRTRLTHTRSLPYDLVQLVLRAARHGPAHGIPAERLGREWREGGGAGAGGDAPRWRHSTRYLVEGGRLLLRVRSHAFAAAGLPPAGVRHLLYERAEYTPYFSVCAHWADGELMRLCRCALAHVPEARPAGVVEHLRRGPRAAAGGLVGRAGAVGGPLECLFCQSARRCPRCPSEYLVRISLVEDAADRLARFKYAIVVTRWVDLGDGLSGPGMGAEWDAVNGVFGGYDSIGRVGRRSLMGIFESAASGSVPGAGLVNMNSKNHTGGKDRD